MLVVASGFAAQSPDDLTVGLDGMVRDGPERLLAFSRAWNNQLAVHENGHWRVLPTGLPGKTVQPRALASLGDGRVASVWAREKNEWLVAVLKDGSLIRTIPFSWPVGSWDRVDVLVASDHSVWLSAEDPRVVRVRPETGGVTVYDLTPHQTAARHKRWNMTGVAEDGGGGIWIWSRFAADNALSANGLLRVNGRKLESPLPGFPGRRLLDVVPRDKDSMWLVDRRLGLYVLHCVPLQVEAAPPPHPNAFHSSTMIFPFGKNWLVLTGSGSRKAVWKYADGDWTDLYPDRKCSFVTWDRDKPPSAEIASGCLLGAQEGVLFVPKGGGPPRLLDWRVGFPLTAPRQILALDGDRFAAISGGGSPPRWIMTDLITYEKKISAANGVRDIVPLAGLAVDARERVFARLSEHPDALSMWDNGTWSEIPFPEGINTSVISFLERDANDRIWGFSRSHLDEPVAVLEADRKSWQVADNFRSALVKFQDDLENFLAEESWLRPVCGPGGKIAFRSPNWTIEFWDGRAWRAWKLGDIVSSVTLSLDPAKSTTPQVLWDDRVSTPFFDAEGRLSVNTLRTTSTWKFGADGQWTPFPKEAGILDPWTNNQPNRVTRRLPPGFPHSLRDPWIVEDNVGTTWVAGGGNLFRWRKGKTVAVFAEGTAHPFLANPPIRGVRVDHQGNAWIRMETGNTSRHVLLPAPPPSPVRLKIATDDNGFAHVEFRPPDTDLEWQVAEGPWRRVPTDVRELGYLPPGTNRINVRLVDARLNVLSLEPVSVSGAPDPTAHLAHLVEILANGPPERREFAVAALEASPAAALPVLDDALAKNPADPWWLEAARQACERALLR